MVICSKCQQDNPDNNMFCGKCGTLLRGERRHNSNLDASTKDELHQLAENTIQEVKKEVHFIESNALEEIHDKAIKWAKVQLFFLGTAVTILLMALFVWGYKQFNDFEQLILDSQQEITTLNLKLTEDAANVSQDSVRVGKQAKDFEQAINQEFNRLNQLRQEINTIDLNQIRKEIQTIQAELLKSIGEAKNLQQQAKSDRFEIQKIQNSFYEIFFQIDDNNPLDDASQKTLFTLLNKNGFLIKDRNIVTHISVNRSEVIYYNLAAKEKAELLVTLLQKDFPTIILRHLDRKERDAREILVKLSY